MDYPVVAFEDPSSLLQKLRGSSVGLVLEQEGLASDLIQQINQLRRQRQYGVSDIIRLSVACGEELWWAFHFNESKILRETKSESVVFVSEFPRELYYRTELAYGVPVALHSIRA